jgi:uncharacterized membrane protein
MSPKDLLQGKWLGHPLHPALVHVPTGLWPATLIFDLVNYFGPHANSLVRTSFACAAAGLMVALAVIPTGIADVWDIKPGKPARTLGFWHAGLNACVFALMAASLWLRWRDHGLDAARIGMLPLICCAAANALLFVSGYLGGRMVYEYGIGVARMSKKKWRQIARDGHAHVPPTES